MFNKFKFIVREVLSLIFWIYLITKLFIFDFDVYLFSNFFPHYSFLLNYKYFFILPAISFYWIIVGNKRFFKNIGYVAFYPFINCFWKIPRALFQKRSWFLIFTYFNTAIAFLKSLKINLFILSLFSISALLIIKSPNHYLITFGIITLLAILVHHFYQKFYFAFNPTTAFAIDSDTLQKGLEDKTFTKLLASNEKKI